MKRTIELLAPAKNLQCGIAAINAGADALYIGAPKFGARSAVGNTLDDIRDLVSHAHKFRVKVFVTVNTILFEDELEEAEELIRELHKIGIDAVIFQDMAIPEMNLPPISLHASTQTNNYDPDRIRFLDSIGVERIILARELSLEHIKEIRKTVKAELEFFVHGALCVSLSGQCYMSKAITNRSANRGECSQPCRMKYDLIDSNGEVLVKDKHLLSLRDFNLSAHLADLIEAGVTSFKIEGRLKDIDYVTNVTAFYRQELDKIIAMNNDLIRASIGKSKIPFSPDPEKSFNREFTTYFLNGKDENLSSINTPKSRGKYLGKVTNVTKNSFSIDTSEKIVNGDGLCYFDWKNDLLGLQVNKVDKNRIITYELNGIRKGTKIFRNSDHSFVSELASQKCERRISASITFESSDTNIILYATDEEGISVSLSLENIYETAKNREKASKTIQKQLKKSGDTILDITEVNVISDSLPFIPVKEINELRRNLLNQLETERSANYKKNEFHLSNNNSTYPEKNLSYKGNVVNSLAKQFYRKHGVEEIEDGFEMNKVKENAELMTCKYCIKGELGYCAKEGSKEIISEPLYLVNRDKAYKLIFDCKNCFMKIAQPINKSDIKKAASK